MHCHEFHEHLDAWLTGGLDDDLTRRMEAHRDRCPECATVADMLRDGTPTPPDTELLGAVLRQTSGSTCSTVQDQLGDWIDGNLERTRADAIADHLGGCAGCRRLHRAMERCGDLLPDLAAADAGPNFTADVLMATIDDPSLWRVFLRRLCDGWQSLVLRPALPLEAGFVATLALVLLTATPVAPWPHLPAQALAVVQGVGEQVRDVDPAGRAWRGLRSTRTAVGSTATEEADEGLLGRWRAVSRELGDVAESGQGLGRALVSFDGDAWLPAAEQLGREARELWNTLRGGVPPTTPDPSREAGASEETS